LAKRGTLKWKGKDYNSKDYIFNSNHNVVYILDLKSNEIEHFNIAKLEQ